MLEKKADFFLKSNFRWLLRMEPGPHEPKYPLPVYESIHLAKKDGASSLPDAGFRRFRPAIPLPPRLFEETNRGESAGFLPALFGFGACFSARATIRAAGRSFCEKRESRKGISLAGSSR